MEKLSIEYRYILRNRAGEELVRLPDGSMRWHSPHGHGDFPRVVWPTYTAALRGRAMVECTAHIIQQERQHESNHVR